MRYWDALFAFLVAMAAAALLTPLAAMVARRVGAMAKPSDRGLAEEETPALGGLAIFAGVLLAGAIWMPGNHHVTRAILAGAAVITLVGAIDDTVELSPLLKLLGQVAAAVLAVVVGGVKVSGVTLPFVGALQFPVDGGLLAVI
jgi:UDP-GlcNAc:undecaprenyl-phosphate GlcNAc-1-phosphate transferase